MAVLSGAAAADRNVCATLKPAVRAFAGDGPAAEAVGFGQHARADLNVGPYKKPTGTAP